jgi:hypothetical protein
VPSLTPAESAQPLLEEQIAPRDRFVMARRHRMSTGCCTASPTCPSTFGGSSRRY